MYTLVYSQDSEFTDVNFILGIIIRAVASLCVAQIVNCCWTLATSNFYTLAPVSFPHSHPFSKFFFLF